MNEHTLKVVPPYFDALVSGSKTPVPPEIVRRAAEALGPDRTIVDRGAIPAAEAVLAAVYGDIVEAARRDAPCPTCQGRNRATTDMVCMTCGRDYLPDDGSDVSAPGLGWLRLLGLWREQAKRMESERDAALADRDRAVEAARRDALRAAARVIGDEAAADGVYGTDIQSGLLRAGWIVGTMARHGLSATVSDQGADPRIPATPGTISGHSGPRASCRACSEFHATGRTEAPA